MKKKVHPHLKGVGKKKKTKNTQNKKKNTHPSTKWWSLPQGGKRGRGRIVADNQQNNLGAQSGALERSIPSHSIPDKSNARDTHIRLTEERED